MLSHFLRHRKNQLGLILDLVNDRIHTRFHRAGLSVSEQHEIQMDTYYKFRDSVRGWHSRMKNLTWALCTILCFSVAASTASALSPYYNGGGYIRLETRGQVWEYRYRTPYVPPYRYYEYRDWLWRYESEFYYWR